MFSPDGPEADLQRRLEPAAHEPDANLPRFRQLPLREYEDWDADPMPPLVIEAFASEDDVRFRCAPGGSHDG
jgi:hypothetical protein